MDNALTTARHNQRLHFTQISRHPQTRNLGLDPCEPGHRVCGDSAHKAEYRRASKIDVFATRAYERRGHRGVRHALLFVSTERLMSRAWPSRCAQRNDHLLNLHGSSGSVVVSL